jgi:multicomponent Na+:H+ antiporter subunit G
LVIEWLTAFALLAGSVFMLIAALGVLRMPDLLTRMHATTKAGVLGAGLTMVAVALHFGTEPVIAKAVAVIAFLLLTAPVAAHAIGRAGYFMGVPLWENTQVDELKGRYDEKTHTLASSDEGESAESEGPTQQG